MHGYNISKANLRKCGAGPKKDWRCTLILDFGRLYEDACPKFSSSSCKAFDKKYVDPRNRTLPVAGEYYTNGP